MSTDYLLDHWDLECRHLYVNAEGLVQFEKLRYKRPNSDAPKGYDKTLRYRHANGDGWVWGMGDGERPLYRLQSITASEPGEPIFVCESEKVCDRLASRNLVATCVASTWSGVNVEALRARDCFVLEDHDADGAGRKKALAAAEAIHRVAHSVRIVPSNGPADGSNIADAIGEGFGVENFVEACQEAPLYHQSEKISNTNGEVSLVWERMSDVEAEPVDWIWPGRIARGKLTLLAGDPGLGKSQITTDIAARITNGELFPDGSKASIGSVLILTAEDAAKDTVRPRLEAVGADLERVHRLKAVVLTDKDRTGSTTFSLQHDLAALGDKLKAVGDVVLVIIDPITSYMGSKIDSHRTTDVRAVLEPLATFAEEHNIAVLAVTHPPKATQTKALHAITGSLAFVAAARLVFLAIEEPETDRRLLLAVKNNLGPLAPGLGFSLVQTIVSKGIVASHVVWDGIPVTMSANEALAANGGDPRAMTEARDFLCEELTDGPRSAQDLKKAALAAGLSWRTVRRAQERLGIKPRKLGLDKGWIWQLPEGGQPPAPKVSNSK